MKDGKKSKKLLVLGILSMILGPILGFIVAIAMAPDAATLPQSAETVWIFIAATGVLLGIGLIITWIRK